MARPRSSSFKDRRSHFSGDGAAGADRCEEEEGKEEEEEDDDSVVVIVVVVMEAVFVVSSTVTAIESFPPFSVVVNVVDGATAAVFLVFGDDDAAPVVLPAAPLTQF